MSSFESIRRSEFEKDLALTLAQYQAVKNELRLTLNAHERPLLEARAQQLEDKMRDSNTQIAAQPKSTDPYYAYLQTQLRFITAWRLQILHKEFEPILYTDPEQVLTTASTNSFAELFEIEFEAQVTGEIIPVDAAIERYQRRVLILGDPGLGKTTLLLRYAYQALLARLADSTQPLPIFERIALWNTEQQPTLAAWLAARLNLPAEQLAVWLRSENVLLLLDGLDELGSERQENKKDEDGKVVKNDKGKPILVTYDPRQRFMERVLADTSAATPLFITCRVKDYEDFQRRHQKLPLNGAVRLQPLTNAQIQQYLSEQPTLWTTIEQDAALLDVARTPFLLRLIAFAFRDAQAQKKLQRQSLKKGVLRDFIFERYVSQSYRYHANRNGGKLPFTLEQVKQVLGEVAYRDAAGYKDNLLYDWDFEHSFRAFQFPQERSAEFIAIAQSLYLLLASNRFPYRFIHLLLRDYFAYPVALARLQDHDKVVSDSAAKALGKIGDTRAVEPLIAALHDVGYSAAIALGKIGDIRAVKPLITTLHDQDQKVRYCAAYALGEIGAPAVKPLIETLHDQDRNIRSFAAAILVNIGKPAVEPLIVALRDQKTRVRARIAEILGKIGDKRAVVPLIEVLKDQHKHVHSRVTEALGKIGSPAVKLLIDALKNQNEGVRCGAIYALGEIGDVRAVKPIIKFLNGVEISSKIRLDEQVCKVAVIALEKIGTPEALEAVRNWYEGE